MPAYAKAYDTAFRCLGTLGLADTEWRIRRLGGKGKAFQPELDDMRRRQHEVNDLLVKAVEMKKQSLVDKKPEAIDAATRILAEADTKGQRLHAEIVRLNEKLTAAGAPQPDPGPPREPGARD